MQADVASGERETKSHQLPRLKLSARNRPLERRCGRGGRGRGPCCSSPSTTLPRAGSVPRLLPACLPLELHAAPLRAPPFASRGGRAAASRSTERCARGIRARPLFAPQRHRGGVPSHSGEVRCLRPNATRLCGTTTPQDGADPQPRLHNAPGCEAAPPAPQGGSKPRTAQRWGRHGGVHGVQHSHGSTGLQPGPAPLAEPLESLRAARPRQALICPSMRKIACRYRLAGKGGAGSSSKGLRSRRKELRAARSCGTDASQL